MSRVNHIFKELGRNLFRHPATALGSFMSLTLLFLLFDLFWIAAGTSERFYTRLLSDLTMEVFIAEEMPDSTLPALRKSVEAIEGVCSVQYVSREQARAELNRLVGADLLVGYETANPLPRSLILTFAPGYLNTAALVRVEKELQQMAGTSQVFYSKRWLSKAESTRALLLNIGMALGGLVLLTAMIGSANNVRLMTQTRAVGFQQMRILGAGRLFLAMPFLLEGILIGGLSAASGWLLIFYLERRVTFTRFELTVPGLEEIAIFSAACALLGLISSYLGIRKMLR